MSEETQAPVRKGRGCCFYGCLAFAILVLLGTLGLVLGVRHYVHWALATYTDTQPAALPKVEATAAEAKAVQDRVASFKTALDSGQAVPPLELDERALNLLLATSSDLQALKDKVHVSLAGDQLKGQVSWPLDELPLVHARGRYLNGSATFKVSLQQGVLIVTLQSLEVRGQQVPEHIMAGLRQQNFARDVYKNAQTAEWMRKLESIAVENGKVTIRAATAEAPR